MDMELWAFLILINIVLLPTYHTSWSLLYAMQPWMAFVPATEYEYQYEYENWKGGDICTFQA